MKFGITGCSHSAGAFNDSKFNTSIDRNAGWVGQLANIYPEHDFILFAKEGTGSTHQEAVLNYFISEQVDVAILQLTDSRVSIGQNYYRSPAEIYERPVPLSHVEYASSEFILQSKTKNLRVCDYDRFWQLCCSVEYTDYITNFKKHYPSRPHWMFFRDSYKNFDLYNNPCFQKYTLESKMLQDNFNYWMMMLDWYDSRFKHFFVLDWCADYYNFTKFKKIARRDWKESVLDFFIRQLQDRNNLTRNQSLAVANRLMEAYGGHLNADQQSDMLTHHILRNPRLLSLLDS